MIAPIKGADEREPEPAPASNLPSWNECAMRVENSDFIAKRVAEGGYGPDADSLLATELHRFIYEYDDADAYRSAWFMHRLEKVVTEARASLGAAQVPSLDVLRGVIEMAREAHAHWDADRDSKVGKILLALAGFSERYDKRSDALHAALSQQGDAK
jgi:hypothetical protein